jgi:hypothetical protein
MQVVGGFPVGQTLPQVPQLTGSAATLTLQPLVRSVPSQLAKPVLQVLLHCELVHETTFTLVVEQAILQPPQLKPSLPVSTLHPLAAMVLSQLAKPVAHVVLHVLPTQVTLVTLVVEHGVLQAPQCITSLVVLISQPSVSLLLLQSAKPATQLPLQALAAQVTVAMLFGEQALVQPPQWLGSLVVSIQTLLQLVPVAHWHEPVTHTMPVGQAWPQVPQLALSVWVSTSQPSLPGEAQSMLQSVNPNWQVQAHTPAVQSGVAWLVEHRFPQAPQLVISVLVTTLQPF